MSIMQSIQHGYLIALLDPGMVQLLDNMMSLKVASFYSETDSSQNDTTSTGSNAFMLRPQCKLRLLVVLSKFFLLW